MKAARILVPLVAILSSGCIRRPIPVVPMAQDYELSLPVSRAQAYDAILAVAVKANLSVDQLEKGSGFIQFKRASLSPTDLDRYCSYPFLKSDGVSPFSTFAGWDKRLRSARAPRALPSTVHGNLSLTFLLEGDDKSTKITMHSNWQAASSTESYECNSLGIFEKDIEDQVQKRLALR